MKALCPKTIFPGRVATFEQPADQRRLHDMQPAAPTYRLADHVRACQIDDQVILLDLHHNRYLGIAGATKLASLARVIDDWPTLRPDSSAAGERDAAKFVAALVRQGLLARAAESRPRQPVLCEPLQTLPPDPASLTASFEWRYLPSLWFNAALVSHWMRHQTLAEIVRHISTGKRRTVSGHQAGDDALQAAVAAYVRVRPFAFTAHDRCLHDSLTLTRFLAARQMCPQWVIGVMTNPFGAHSWVQSGHTVLNDLHENVRRYHPILIV